MKITRLIAGEVGETLRRPSRLLNAFNPGRIAGYLRFQRLRLISRDGWSGTGAVAKRGMASYDEYIELQRSKLQYLDLSGHEVRFRKALASRLSDASLVRHGDRVLCLGARLGAEVAAFRDLGAFAVGVDLNPGQDNPWVLFGDFHDLKYPDACLDTVYSNSLDHCMEPARVLAEVRRMLRPAGTLLVEADPGVEEADGIAPDIWATFSWKTVDALRDLISSNGFRFLGAKPFDYPRHGTALHFERAD